MASLADWRGKIAVSNGTVGVANAKALAETQIESAHSLSEQWQQANSDEGIRSGSRSRYEKEGDDDIVDW